MMKVYLVFVFISCAAAYDCPKMIKGKRNFDINKFTGTWYRIRYGDNILGGKCLSMTYSVNKNGTISAVRKAISEYIGKPFIIEGWFEYENGEVTYVFPSYNFKAICGRIVDTDYISYVVVWGWPLGKEVAWVMTREQHPERKVWEKALRVANNNGISHRLLNREDQQYCPKDSEGKAPSI